MEACKEATSRASVFVIFFGAGLKHSYLSVEATAARRTKFPGSIERRKLAPTIGKLGHAGSQLAMLICDLKTLTSRKMLTLLVANHEEDDSNCKFILVASRKKTPDKEC
ncbi:hypothetical protein TSAR_007807 [Trichomalopsis sarcophagae]|uniref:Uncharacterized protein n=1 Tax=Trichomalopsis sarcophagae TaxID=543379 RepID=A0A232ENJ7_9HYME|nr:hypothetical protein TSAR_007807 [Trichomalopsis sarcophagae]